MQAKQVRDVNEKFIFSTYYFAAGAIPNGDYRLFKTSIGNQGQGFPPGYTLQESDTNLESNDGLPKGLDFNAESIGIALKLSMFDNVVPSPALFNFVNDYLWGTAVIFEQMSKKENLGTPDMYPAGFGVIQQEDWSEVAAADHSFFNAQNGIPSIQARIRRRFPLTIIGGEQFAFNLKLATFPPGITIPANAVYLKVKLAMYGVYSEHIANL